MGCGFVGLLAPRQEAGDGRVRSAEIVGPQGCVPISHLSPDDARFDWERPRPLAGAAHVWKGIAIELKPRNLV